MMKDKDSRIISEFGPCCLERVFYKPKIATAIGERTP